MTASWGDRIADHLPALQRYARSLTRDQDSAGDLIQDAVERALNKEHLYEPDSNLRAWLFTIMRNIWFDRVRRGGRVTYMPVEELPIQTVRPNQDAIVDAKRFVAAFRYLEPEHKVLLIAIADGDTYETIAARLGIPLGTVRSRLFRARNRLERLMAGGAVLMDLVEEGGEE